MRLRPESKQEKVDREERERIARSNQQREIARQRGYVAGLDLTLHQTRERISELKKEIAELEKQAATRERKLNQARVKLTQLECAQ